MGLEIFGDSFLSLLSRVKTSKILWIIILFHDFQIFYCLSEVWLFNGLLNDGQTLVWLAQYKEAIVSKIRVVYVFE